ncbi:MAG TPA: SAM-dependent methyltransferase [Amycolatopsis sp.]|uniref:SAM-dependent methyltransferase n=1 Tax=Amycolatopsis sp. TaxID=37632 RepID=UPI002B48A511|nr:SAM-dependent methyltransferase [Amycolatopsis sp.]HKS46536.1 SAM-dependent methyltransferase [Amycolatopsis sp.]
MAPPVGSQNLHTPQAHPSIARVNDCWLDGHHHDQRDNDYADQIAVCAPHIPYLVRASRALTGRMVRYMLDQGVRQFLDLGSGIPTMGHVHEVAQAVDPGSRVVYVDADPHVAAEGRAILSEVGNVAYLAADIRQPGQILSSPEFRGLIDLTEPVGLLAVETLLYLTEGDDPRRLVATYADALAPGSFVGLTHCSENAELRKGLSLFSKIYGKPPVVTLRDADELRACFRGLDLVDPGVVPVPLWNPLTEDDVGQNPELAPMAAGLGKKA